MGKYVRGGEKALKAEYEVLCKLKKVLMEEKRHLRFGNWNQADIEVLNKHLFITSKPMLYLVNLSEKDYMRKKNKWLPKIKEYVDKNDPGAMIIPFSGSFEQKLMDLESEDEKKAYMGETKCTSSLDKIVVQGYKALQLQYFFTAGPDEVKAWTIQKGSKAPQAAGRIHTDFEKGSGGIQTARQELHSSRRRHHIFQIQRWCWSDGRKEEVKSVSFPCSNHHVSCVLKAKLKEC